MAKLIFCLVFLLATLSCRQETKSAHVAFSHENVGLSSLTDLTRLSVLSAGALGDGDFWMQCFSSADHSGVNNDGFKPEIDFPLPYTRTYEYFDSESHEFVLAEVHGCGVATRIRFARPTGMATTDRRLGDDTYKLKIYLDDAKVPVFVGTMAELTSGLVKGLAHPLVAGEAESAGGLFINVPLPFRSYFRVAAMGKPHFFGISILRLASPLKWETYTTLADTKAAISALNSAGQPLPITRPKDKRVDGTVNLKSASASTIFLRRTQGTITEITLTPKTGFWCQEDLQDAYIKIYYDDEENSPVDCPLGLFFGSGLHGKSITSKAFGRRKGGTGYCHLPMPFAKACRIELVNDSQKTLTFAYSVLCSDTVPGEKFGHFSVHYQKTQSPKRDQDVSVLKIKGQGKIVAMSEDLLTNDLLVLEGNTRIYVDGVRSPALQSGGHETWWGWAWYRGPLDAPYQLPTQGYTFKEKDGDTFQRSFYRNFITDYMPFKNGIEISFQHGPVNSTEGEFRTAVFFYHQPKRGQYLSDELDPGNTSNEIAHGYSRSKMTPLRSRVAVFEGREMNQYVDQGYIIEGESRFRMNIDHQNHGVRLLRLSDPSTAEKQQCADVFVDGKFAGEWFQPHNNPARMIFFNNRIQPECGRWLEDQFSIPPALTKGKKSIEIRIVTKGHWNEYGYRVFSIR